MASKRVQGGELQAVTEWCNDLQWKERNGTLAMGVWNRLAAVDRALFASNRIAEMLIRDQRGKSDARNDENVTYHGLSAIDAEALSLAIVELGNRAEEVLGQIRDNKYGCCSKSEAHA